MLDLSSDLIHPKNKFCRGAQFGHQGCGLWAVGCELRPSMLIQLYSQVTGLRRPQAGL